MMKKLITIHMDIRDFEEKEIFLLGGKEVQNYMDNLEMQLPELKGKREILWRKHKTANVNEKKDILKEINELTDKINAIHAQKNACSRIIDRYEEIIEDYKKELESNEKLQELIIADRKKKVRNS